MRQLERFTIKGKKELVCKLKKDFYGIKKSPRMWCQKFNTYIIGLGFVRSKADHYVYCKQVGEHFVDVVLYVHDMLVGKSVEIIKEVK